MKTEGMPTRVACRVLEVSESGFYAWRSRPPSARAIRHAWLGDLIHQVHQQSRGTYGALRVHAELRLGYGIGVGHNAVAMLMRRAGLQGLSGNRGRRQRIRPVDTPADLVDRNFARHEPDQLWVTDITEHPTREGKVYCAVVLDVFSRRIVGWSIDSSATSGLVTSALGMAISNRQPDTGTVIHSDQGTQGGFNWWSQHLVMKEVMMGVVKGREAVRALRPAMRSPGRPPVGRREHRERFWEGIAGGLSSEDAGVAAGVSAAVGSRWFRENGGMAPFVFVSVSGRYLSFVEREEIALLHARDCGVREIARRLGRAPSTISRELRRNAATRGGGLEYRATTAQWHSDRRASRPKVAKLAENDALRHYVQDRLGGIIARPDGELVPGPQVRWVGRRHGPRKDRRWATSWSPEQISNRLRVDFPHNESMRISHEAIYQALYVQGRGALKRELVACLRTGRALRVPRARTRQRGRKFVSPEIMISQRPAEADDRAVPGHWEGDLIIGLRSSAIGTLVERTTRFTMLLHLPPMPGHGEGQRAKNGPALAGHGAQAVRDAIASAITTLPQQLRKSLTWDQGAEMAQHAQLRIDAGLAIYFCDPHSPWQRGTNENTNGLLRQYFPKGTDLHRHSRDDLNAVATALNSRPRKTLGWETPAEALDNLLRSTP